MKQLTCEMCGGTDLIKQDGVFVCQSCGCKYSIEEAKKMMVEGTVEVAGTVKVDDSAKIENYLVLSQNAYNSGNGQSAFDYANKALEISPKNSRAWIAKMKAIEYIGTLGELKLMEVVEAGKNAVAFADEVSQKEITFEVYSYEAIRSLELLKLAMNKMADTEDVEKTCLQFAAINILTANKNTLDVDSKVVNIYDNIAKEALAMIQLIPDEVLADYPEITKIIGECAKQYQYVTDALIKRFKLYGAELQESAKTMRENNKTAIENKAKAAEKIALERKTKEQAERNLQYWADHHADKLELENETAELIEKNSKLVKAIEALPENSTVKQIEIQIATLKKEKDALGIFKGKEKKALQEQINGLNDRLATAKAEKDSAVAPIQTEINDLNKRIQEIETELSKDR